MLYFRKGNDFARVHSDTQYGNGFSSAKVEVYDFAIDDWVESSELKAEIQFSTEWAPYTEQSLPITWSSAADCVIYARTYAYAWLRQHPEPHHTHTQDQSMLAYRAIMERIYSNLRNPNWRAYPSEISYSTVAGSLKRQLNLCETDFASIVSVLDKAWEDVRQHFAQKFTKP